MAKLITVCTSDELPVGGVRTISYEDLEIGVFNCNGEIYAIEDRCSHDNGPLAEGDVDSTTCTVECPRHGSLFDLRTGAAKTLPAYQAVESYPVHITDGTIKVEVE